MYVEDKILTPWFSLQSTYFSRHDVALPGFAKLFTHPNFHPEKDVIATKSFFQSDKMEVEWSYDGRMALLLTQSEVDKTGGSCYGKQQLHFMAANGTTALVQLPKQGPIYSFKWSPSALEFVVIYGFMPCASTIFITSS